MDKYGEEFYYDDYEWSREEFTTLLLEESIVDNNDKEVIYVSC